MNFFLLQFLGIIVTAVGSIYCLCFSFLNFQNNHFVLSFVMALCASVWTYTFWQFVNGKSVFLKTYAKKT